MKNVLNAILFLSFTAVFGQNKPVPKTPVKLTKENSIDKNAISENNTDYIIVETQALPKGGIEAFKRYISSSIVLPKVEKDTMAEVFVKFLIVEDGAIQGVQVVKESPEGLGLGTEVIRVLSNSPKWVPAVRNGKFIKQYFTLPIKLQLVATEKTDMSTQKVIVKDNSVLYNATSSETVNKDPVDYNQIFNSVEVNAVPPGGLNDFRKKIASSFVLPDVDTTIICKIVARFVVWNDGSIRNIEIIKEEPFGLGLGKEFVRILLNSEKWKPGMHNGKIVNQYYTMPVMIQIQGSEIDNSIENENKSNQKKE